MTHSVDSGQIQNLAPLLNELAQMVKNLPAMRETWVLSLCWEDALEKGRATHCKTMLVCTRLSPCYIIPPSVVVCRHLYMKKQLGKSGSLDINMDSNNDFLCDFKQAI